MSTPATTHEGLTQQQPKSVIMDTEEKLVRMVDLGTLSVDHTYQRPPGRKAEEIGKGWNASLVGVIVVSDRGNGEMVIVDGQNRWIGARAAGLDELPADIRMGMTIEEEAKLFDDLNTGRSYVSAIDRFRARLIYRDPIAIDINQIIHDYEGEIAERLGSKYSDQTSVRAVAQLERVYKALGADGLRAILSVIKEAWGAIDYDTTNEFTLGGLRQFAQRQRDADRDRLITRLREEGYGQIRRMAHAHGQIFGGSGPLNWYRACVEAYNKHASQANRLKP